MLRLPGHLYRWDRQEFKRTTDWTQTSNYWNGDINNHIAEHHLQTNHRIDWDSAECITYSTNYYQRLTLESWFTKGLFTWREGAPANRATRIGGLKHSPPLHASHLGEIVSWAAANHNKQDGGQQKRFGGIFFFFIIRSANGRFSVSRARSLHFG